MPRFFGSRPVCPEPISRGRPRPAALLARAALVAGASAGRLGAAWAQEPEAPAAPVVTVTPAFPVGEWLDAGAALELRVAPAPPAGSRLAIFVGPTDVTALFATAPGVLAYRPAAIRLPAGESELVVHLVGAHGGWQEVGRVPLRLRTAGGWEKASFDPKLEVGNEGQVAEDHQPAASQPPRETFQDFTAGTGFTSLHVRNGWSLGSQLNILGVSQREKALRFNEKGRRAPQVDLSDYRVEVEKGSVRASLGHVAWEGNRHLVGQFASRGATARVRLGPRADLTAAVLHGSTIVGWSRFLGVERRNHRVGGATLGVEAFPAVPGLLRLEATGVSGSLLPTAGFTEGVVNDAENSRGWGIRLVAATPDQRGRIEAGYSRSRFGNPADPLLSQGAALVPVRETSRSARYLEAAVDVIRAWAITPTLQGRLAAAYRHEQTDPLYRSIAATIQADRATHVLELQGGVGEASFQLSRARSRDNLDRIPTILLTRGTDWAFTAAAPVAFLVGAAARPAWLPALSYRYQRTHQKGDGVPLGADARATFVPDQVSAVHGLGLDWQGTGWRAAYRLDHSSQDNRQPERELADNSNLVHGVSVELALWPPLTAAFDLGFERASNLEIDRRDRTRRTGVTLEWRAARATSVGLRWSRTDAEDDRRVRQSDGSDLSAQVTQRLDVFRVAGAALPAQAFLRFGRVTARTLDREFDVNDSRRSWTANTGLNLTLF